MSSRFGKANPETEARYSALRWKGFLYGVIGSALLLGVIWLVTELGG